MMVFHLLPGGNPNLLRNRHKTSLRSLANDLFGEEGPTLLSKLQHAYRYPEDFERWARNILRHCARIKDERRRYRYIESCILRQRRITELESWLNKNPDPGEVLDSQELREIGRTELREYYKKAGETEFELDVLRGAKLGLTLLINRIGNERAWGAVYKLANVFDLDSNKGAYRVNLILTNAARPTTRFPESYVDAALENERMTKSMSRRKRPHKRGE